MKLAVWITIIWLCSGCVFDVANRYYSSEKYPPRDPASVELLTSEPKRPYTLIADFQSTGDTPETLRKKAADLGCDAIIVTGLGGSGNMSAWIGGEDQSKDYSHIVGSAIKYK